jgi:hypothetical protein
MRFSVVGVTVGFTFPNITGCLSSCNESEKMKRERERER